MFALMALVYWLRRPQTLLPSNHAERRLWSIWAGFVLSCSLVSRISNFQMGLDKLYDYVLYPYWAVLSGFAFCITAASYWGWAYIFGAAFFVLAMILPFIPAASPLAFGSLWALCLIIMGLRLKRLSQDT